MLPFSSSIRSFLNNATVTAVANRIDSACDLVRPSPATTQKLTRIAGGLLFVYGAYTAIPLISQIFKLAIENLTYTKAIEALVKQFQNCSVANALWQTVEKEGQFSIEFFGNLKAIWYREVRLIRIQPQMDIHEKIAGLLFELCNAIQSREILAVDTIAATGTLGLSEFVKKIIHIEYHSILLSSQIAPKCVEDNAWSPGIIPYVAKPDKLLSSYAEFFPQYVLNNNVTWHRQHVANMWLSRFRTSFCEKSPFSLECEVAPAEHYDSILLDSIAFDQNRWQCSLS